jgi:hypothetical protein
LQRIGAVIVWQDFGPNHGTRETFKTTNDFQFVWQDSENLQPAFAPNK